MSLPWTDWQFWVVTAVAAGGVYFLVRPLVSRPGADPGCGHCVGCPPPEPERPLVTLGGGRRGAAKP